MGISQKKIKLKKCAYTIGTPWTKVTQALQECLIQKTGCLRERRSARPSERDTLIHGLFPIHIFQNHMNQNYWTQYFFHFISLNELNMVVLILKQTIMARDFRGPGLGPKPNADMSSFHPCVHTSCTEVSEHARLVVNEWILKATRPQRKGNP